MKIALLIITGLVSFSTLTSSCKNQNNKNMNTQEIKTSSDKTNMIDGTRDTAYFAAGCYWCVEAVFQRLEGVDTIVSGFTGGKIKNPSYREVCNGTTGHAEACKIIYDPAKITYLELLQVFFKTHDPTTLNKQGNDSGTQYRSAIFYTNDEQKKIAESIKEELNKSGAWSNPIVTDISPFTIFYTAEDYHQNYFNQNGDQPYCQYVIQPKVEKFEKVFKDKMKKEYLSK